jgi:hypothetical protein
MNSKFQTVAHLATTLSAVVALLVLSYTMYKDVEVKERQAMLQWKEGEFIQL